MPRAMGGVIMTYLKQILTHSWFSISNFKKKSVVVVMVMVVMVLVVVVSARPGRVWLPTVAG